MTTQHLHPAIGDPAAFMRDMDVFKKSCAFFDAHYGELLAAYPDEFIGIFDGQVRAHGTDLLEMLGQLDALDVPRETTYVEFLAVDPRPAIL